MKTGFSLAQFNTCNIRVECEGSSKAAADVHLVNEEQFVSAADSNSKIDGTAECYNVKAQNFNRRQF